MGDVVITLRFGSLFLSLYSSGSWFVEYETGEGMELGQDEIEEILKDYIKENSSGEDF